MSRGYVLNEAHLEHELEMVERAGGLLCGVDEAGRGALAGPVVASALVLLDDDLPGLADSKEVTAKRREKLFEQLQTRAIIGVGVVGPADIDRLNILQANFLAMQLALRELTAKLTADAPLTSVLVDGDYLTEQLQQEVVSSGARIFAVVKGDAKVRAISAASIIAKVTRDRLMHAIDSTHPGYGFAANAGYGSPSHLAGLKAHGPSAIHRMTFAPVAAARAALAPT